MSTEILSLDSQDDVALADKMNAGRKQILTELHKRVIGQEEVLEQVLLSLFVGGNSLIVGVPGLAKTLLIHTMAQVLDLKFSRIQFTPDLMPSDITGTDIIQDDPNTGRRHMVFTPGPIFANIVLAAENAVGAPRGNAGAPRHGARQDLQARRAVPRLRDAEPDRARGHVSLAGS